jgi:uncharacterized protein YndB with AHSA1/START domain
VIRRAVLRYESSIIIDCPVDKVFEYMQDIDREREWQPNLREAEQTPEGEPGIGTRRRYVSEFMGKRFENVYVNTVYEPNRRVAYKSARVRHSGRRRNHLGEGR